MAERVLPPHGGELVASVHAYLRLETYVTVLVTYVTVSGWLPIYILRTARVSSIAHLIMPHVSKRAIE
jgi:hypothetical protein